MTWFRRKPPARQPHPDARIEAELQRVLALQRSAARTEAVIDRLNSEAGKMDTYARKHPHLYGSAEGSSARAQELRDEAAEQEERVAKLHDEIAKRLEALGEDALWLGGGS